MTEIVIRQSVIDAGIVADTVARSSVFHTELSKRPANTLASYRVDLQTWCCYLESCNVECAGDWFNDPTRWAGVTFGLVQGFASWLLREGYAIATVNRKLSTVRHFSALAGKAGVIPSATLSEIREVKVISFADGINIDQKRERKRLGSKKVKATPIGTDQAHSLKTGQPQSPQGWRDALIMCLLLDHGLRAGEAVLLTVDAFSIADETFTFYRPKVSKVQNHKLTKDTLCALRSYLAADGAPSAGKLLVGSRKGGQLSGKAITRENLSRRVASLGKAIGIDHLSAHDCRHYWATTATRNKTNPLALKQAGGWNSIAMVSRYVEESEISNIGVNLGGNE